MVKLKVRSENGRLVYYFEDDKVNNPNEVRYFPSGFFNAAFPEFAAEKKKEEKQD